MPQTRLDEVDAAELAETLTFLARWLSGGQKPALDQSLATLVGHPACTTDDLSADLHRFAFLLGATDGEELFGEPVAMITTTDTARQLDRITRITPIICRLASPGMCAA
jgi:hypothetical protein